MPAVGQLAGVLEVEAAAARNPLSHPDYTIPGAIIQGALIGLQPGGTDTLRKRHRLKKEPGHRPQRKEETS